MRLLWEQNDLQHPDAGCNCTSARNTYIKPKEIREIYRYSGKILTLNCLSAVTRL